MSLNLPYGSKKEQIYTILQQSPKKTALERNEKLASLLNYKDPFQRKLEFSSPSPLKLLSYIQSEILSSAINKNK